jgi:hypothetical protein
MRPLVKTLALAVPGLVFGLSFAWHPAASGQGPATSRQDAGASSSQQKTDQGERRDRDGEKGPGAPSEGLERALKSFQEYREGTGKGVEQSRKEIDRLVRELTSLIEMRYQMAVALASHRAETQQEFGQPQPEAPSPGASPGQATEEGVVKESSIRRLEAIARELEQVQNQVRNEIAQARGQAEMLAAQIRAVREQHRARLKAEAEQRERDASAAKKQENPGQPRERDRD